MQAVILAAGMGKRLGAYTLNNTKCMLEINGVKLIDRALECLYEVGVSRVVLVVGYKGQNVKDYVGNNYKGIPIEYVDNPIYYKTNNIYSFYLAKDYLMIEDTILLESDLIFETAVVKRLLVDPFPNIALVDKYASWMDGTVVTLDEEGRIARFIDKLGFKFSEIEDYYKTVNIYKFSKDFLTNYYLPFLEAYCKALGNNEYYEQVLRVILHLHGTPVKALPLSGEVWYEIDDIQDLDIASSMFALSEEEHYQAYICRYGGYWRYPRMLDYCYLVNPFFPPQRMIDELKASFESLLREYPSGMKVNSLLASKNFNVNQDYIVVGNGATELIKALMEGNVGKLGNIIPTFEEYPNRLQNENLIQYTPLTDDYHYSADDVMEYFIDKNIDTLLLINPDNPSGNFISREDVLRLVDWTKKRNTRLVIDESFVDFANDGFSMLDNQLLASNPHLFVVKSISKSYGVPGLRLGVLASGNTKAIAKIKKDVAIWNINSFGEFFMQIFEKYQKDYLLACNQFREEREKFREELEAVPFIKVYNSQANFFLCEITEKYSSSELARKLLGENVLVKDCNGKIAMKGRNLIRLAIRDRQDNAKLIKVLKAL